MQKTLKVLFAFAILVLVIGVHTDSYACHGERGPHGDCRDDATYSVTGFETLSFEMVVGEAGPGKKNNKIQVNFAVPGPNLSFFEELFDELDGEGTAGTNCFRGAPLAAFGDSMLISLAKDGTAFVQYFFEGFGDDESDTEIKYQLEMFGGFVKNPLPPVVGTTRMTFTDWEMSTEGKGKNRMISCTGFGGGGFGAMIDVGKN